MIYGFEKNVTYHDTRDPDNYIVVVWCIQYGFCWHIWAIWYSKKDDCFIREHKKWYIDKKNLRFWDYGKNGRN